jgi:hypothetical protein
MQHYTGYRGYFFHAFRRAILREIPESKPSHQHSLRQKVQLFRALPVFL